MKASSMADRSGKSSDGLASGAGPRGGGPLVSEMLMMFRITSPQRTKIVLLGVAVVLVIAATAFGQIRLNAWNQPLGIDIWRQRPALDGFEWNMIGIHP